MEIMKRQIGYAIALLLLFLAGGTLVQAQKEGVVIDVQHYQIDAELIPSSQILRARTEVTFVPQSDTRSVVFEMNGALAIKRIYHKNAEPVATPTPASASKSTPRPMRAKTDQPNANDIKGAAAPTGETAGAQSTDLQFIQDNRENLNVRVDLGAVKPGKQPMTLVFEYEGALESAQGGPIQNARLAYVGDGGSYLFYAARWFPFHEYAADRATSRIKITVPKGVIATGYSDEFVAPVAFVDPKTKAEFLTFTFNSSKPTLPGTIAAAKYLNRTANFGGFSVDLYFRAGREQWADHIAEVVGKHLEYYSGKFGQYAFGNKLIVAETDDETIPTYSGAGIMFIAPRSLTEGFDETISRETAYQWWGQAVGIRSFDDIWLSQGLAEFSQLLFIKDTGNESLFLQALQAQLERALAFEQSASIRNAPQQLDDQTPAYRSIVYYKGSLVFNMLRQLVGDQKFEQLLREYYKRYSGKNVNLDEFEKFTSEAAGRPMRFFFGQWIDSTGVPEFRAEFRMLRQKDGFRVPGTVKQDLDTFEMPVDILLKTETGNERETLVMKGPSADFDIQTKSKPIDIVVDPDMKILRSSEELRQGVIIRRGIEHVREQEYVEAEQQFQAAIKLNRGLSWAWYNLGLLYLTQRNYTKALDAFDQALNGNLRPDWTEVWSYIYRGNAWDALGNRERAVAEYKRATDNGNNYDNAQAVAQEYMAKPFDPKRVKQSETTSQAN
jgi:tetratricopeptide (TPR) repeat protein